MTPRPAATLVVVRPGAEGIEVLMLERPEDGYFGGLWVFPGGGVEDADHSPLARRAVTGDGADHPWRAAALRETVEEVGLAVTTPPSPRSMVAEGPAVFESVLQSSARLDGAGIRLLSRWVTPEGAPTRYDTRFYLAVMEGDPALVPRPAEVIDVAWVDPADALARGEEGSWSLVLPTIHHLRWLERHRDVRSAREAADRGTGAWAEPDLEWVGSGPQIVVPSAEMP